MNPLDGGLPESAAPRVVTPSCAPSLRFFVALMVVSLQLAHVAVRWWSLEEKHADAGSRRPWVAMAFHPPAGWCDCMSADFEKGGKQGFLNLF